MTSYESDDWMRFVCPACGAHPWMPCHIVGPRRVHVSRVEVGRAWRERKRRIEREWDELNAAAEGAA